MVPRLAIYTALSTSLFSAVTLSALNSRPNFYAAAVAVGRNSGSMMVVWNMIIWAGLVLGLGVRRLFFGQLRSIEHEVCPPFTSLPLQNLLRLLSPRPNRSALLVTKSRVARIPCSPGMGVDGKRQMVPHSSYPTLHSHQIYLKRYGGETETQPLSGRSDETSLRWFSFSEGRDRARARFDYVGLCFHVWTTCS